MVAVAVQGQVRVASAVLPPVAACWLEGLLWDSVQPSAWMLFFPAVIVSARYGGRLAGIAAAILSSILALYFFLPPQGAFSLDNPRDAYATVLFLTVSTLTALLVSSRRVAAQTPGALPADSDSRARITGQEDTPPPTSDSSAAQRAVSETPQSLRRVSAPFRSREDELWLSLALDASRAALWAWDIPSGRVTIDERWAEIAGYPLNELEPFDIHRWAGLCHPDDIGESDAILDACFAGTRTHYEYAKRLRHKNGAWVWTMDFGKVVEWSDDGKPLLMVGTHFDVTERKVAEDAARERDAVMRTALDATGEPVFVIGLEGEVLALNSIAAKRLNRTAADILSRPIFDFLPPYVVEWRRARLAEALQGKQPVHVEDECDGCWLDHVIYPLKDDRGEVTKLVVFARDITEKKRFEASVVREKRIAEARAALLQTTQDTDLEVLLRETVDQACGLTDSPIGFYHFLEEDQRTISLQVWSTATECEYCTAEGSGLHYDYEKAGVWADCIREGKPVIHNDYASLPHRKGMPEGHAVVTRELVVPVSRGPKIVAILGVGNKGSDYTQEDVDTVFRLADLAWDIVARRHAEEAKRAVEARMHKIFALGLVGMTVSSTEMEWIAFNDRLCEMLGYTREELEHKSWPELTHPEDLEIDVADFNRVLSGEIESYKLRKRYIRKDGSVLYAMVSVSAVRKADGTVDYFLALVHDIGDLMAAQEALMRSNESYNSFISQSHEAIYRTDLDIPVDISLPVEQQIDAIYANAYIGECNQAMAAMYGAQSPEHLIGRRLSELHGDARSPVNRAAIRRFIEAGYRVEDNETEEVAPSGSRRWFLSNEVGFVENGKLIRTWVTCVDITGRKQAEEALRNSEERYRALVETLSDWIWEVDAEGRYVYASPRVREVLGYSPGELLGRTPFDIMHESEARRIRDVFGEIVRDRRPFFNLENTCLAKDGRTVIMETSGVPVLDSEGRWVGFRGVDRDITDRKTAEVALREREEELRAIIQTAQDGFWMTDLEGRLLQVNDAYCRMSGYSANELLTMRIADLEAAESEAETRDHIRRVQLSRYDRFESRHRRKDGSDYDIEVSVHYRPENEGRIVVFLRDITDQRHSQTERLRLEEQLRQSQKLEAIGLLAGGVAHDFNNLLQVMMGYVQLAAGDLGKGHPLRQELREVVRAGERARDLVNQLLTFSRRQIMRPAALDLNAVISGFLKMLHRVIGEHIQLEFRPGGGIGPIFADQGMIEQVLMNLCVNARDAMGSGGTLTIETRAAAIDKETMESGGFPKPGMYAELSISDTGCGMDTETLSRVFDPFFTTKEQGKGTGLGLSTVYGIVGQHSGTIQVRSEPGRGSTFSVYLPIVESPVEGTSEESSLASPGGTETILLAEDDEGVRKLASRILSEAGYTVLWAANGAEAIKRFNEHRDTVRLLLLDVVMPVMGGREAFERIRHSAPDIPVLFASGYAEDALHADFTLPEGMELMRKPYLPEELLTKVRCALDACVLERAEHGD